MIEIYEWAVVRAFRDPGRCAQLKPGRLCSVGCRSDAAAQRIARVLTNDPAAGVISHADTGYQTAIDYARQQGLNSPMIL